jgi:DNA-binding HxlR family transcriptional regulator
MPPRTSYELAPAGEELQRVIDAIDDWARKNLPVSVRATEADLVSPARVS